MTISSPNDAGGDSSRRLVRQARSDSKSFAVLFERQAPALYAWARLHVLPELSSLLDADDLVQEVCFRAFTSFPTYSEERTKFRGWLFGIANNVLRQALRKRRSIRGHPAVRPTENDGELDELPGEITSISRAAARDEELQKVVDKLRSLEAEDREIFIYRVLEEMKHAAIAEVLGISPAAAEKRWQRVQEKLAASGVSLEIFGD